MYYNINVIYDCTPAKLHPYIPLMMEYCDKYNVNPYFIASIFKFETEKHPILIEYKNLGNVKSEDSEFMLPIRYDSIETSMEYYIRLMHYNINQNEIFTPEDINKLLRPLEPEWADRVYEYTVEMYKKSGYRI